MIESKTGAHGVTPAVPPELQSPRSKLVFLYLSTNETASVGQMASSLGMKKIALYSILKTLRKQGIVERADDRYTLA